MVTSAKKESGKRNILNFNNVYCVDGINNCFMLTKSNRIKLAQAGLSEDRSIWCNKDLFFFGVEIVLPAKRVSRDWHMGPMPNCPRRQGSDVAWGWVCPCMAWVTRRSARLQFFREAPHPHPPLFSALFRLDFTHSSAPLSLPHHLQTVRMLCHTHTHTPLELNQKSMLSMASQYLIKQSPCPSWQVMHFIVQTHTHTHSDSLSLTCHTL